MSDQLSSRERQIVGLVAWGAAYKEVPGLLRELYGGEEISVNTVRNTLVKVYEKLHLGKLNELSAWWFTHEHGVDVRDAPAMSLRKRLLSLALLVIITPQILSADMDQSLRPSRIRVRARTERVEGGRRKE